MRYKSEENGLWGQVKAGIQVLPITTCYHHSALVSSYVTGEDEANDSSCLHRHYMRQVDNLSKMWVLFILFTCPIIDCWEACECFTPCLVHSQRNRDAACYYYEAGHVIRCYCSSGCPNFTPFSLLITTAYCDVIPKLRTASLY